MSLLRRSFVLFVALLPLACGPGRPSVPDDNGPGTIGGGGGGGDGSPDAGSNDTPDAGGSRCGSSDDCSGFPCVNGRCVVACQSDDDCDATETCNAGLGVCVPRTATTTPVGAACTGDGPCGDGFCTRGEFTGGYCTLSCRADADCPSGSNCFNGSICVKNCTSGSQCRSGYECVDGDTSGRRECLPASTAADLPIGEACSSDGDCGNGGECLQENLAAGFLGGYCTAACSQDSDCGDSARCFADRCWASCTTRSQCRTGYDCLATTAGSNVKVCASASTGTTRVGAACTRYTQCQGASSAMCLTTWPSGYCSQLCTNASCPSGSVCVQDSAQPELQFCVDTCSETDTCRGGYSCQDLGDGTTVCGPA